MRFTICMGRATVTVEDTLRAVWIGHRWAWYVRAAARHADREGR